MTELDALNELRRIAEKVGHVTSLNFDQHGRQGFTLYTIKKATGLTLSQMKRKMGLSTRADSRPIKVVEAEKVSRVHSIFCQSLDGGNGGIIKKIMCVPYYKDTCKGCKVVQLDNPKCIDKMSPEEERESALTIPGASRFYNE